MPYVPLFTSSPLSKSASSARQRIPTQWLLDLVADNFYHENRDSRWPGYRNLGPFREASACSDSANAPSAQMTYSA